METIALPSKISRVDSRYRHWAQDVSQRGEAAQGQGVEEEEALPQQDVDEPLLIREQKGRAVMGQAHRLFHRRAAQASSNILTVNVEVVATLDASGNVVGQETITPSIPVVPAVPTDPLPSVPSVPAFPSDLTVPAYPWPSGVPSAQATNPTSQVVISVSATTTAAGSSSILPTAFPSASGFNSTISNTVISSTTHSSLNSTSATSTRTSTRSSNSSTRTSTSSASSTNAATSSAAASSAGGGGGGLNPVNTAAPPAASTTAAATVGQSDGGSLGTPEVVGTVFGSLAGAALLLALILFLIRRHKQKQRGGALQLTGDDNTDRAPMAQTAARSSFVTPSFLNRFSGASRSTAESSTGERGFQRISGRKLPSAFSEGMTSEQFARGEGTFSGSSFYKDEKGVYGGPGVIPKDFGKETGETSNAGAVGVKERVMPSPARTPVIHHPEDAPPFGTSRNGGGSTLSPPHTPNPDVPPRGTLGRSHPSHDGSRSSRFTENV